MGKRANTICMQGMRDPHIQGMMCLASKPSDCYEEVTPKDASHSKARLNLILTEPDECQGSQPPWVLSGMGQHSTNPLKFHGYLEPGRLLALCWHQKNRHSVRRP